MKKKSLVSICISVCATLVACSMMLSGCTTEKHRHDYGKWKITVEPTCTQEGEKIRSCDCGATKTRKIPVTGRHVYGEDNLCAECGIEI